MERRVEVTAVTVMTTMEVAMTYWSSSGEVSDGGGGGGGGDGGGWWIWLVRGCSLYRALHRNDMV